MQERANFSSVLSPIHNADNTRIALAEAALSEVDFRSESSCDDEITEDERYFCHSAANKGATKLAAIQNPQSLIQNCATSQGTPAGQNRALPMPARGSASQAGEHIKIFDTSPEQAIEN